MSSVTAHSDLLNRHVDDLSPNHRTPAPRVDVLPVKRVGNASLTEDEKRKIALAGTPKERAQFLLTDVFIHTSDVDNLVSSIEDLLSYKREVPELCGGMRIVAPGGMGKDTIMTHFARKYGPSGEGREFSCPVIHATLRGSVSPKNLLRALLQQLDCLVTIYQTIEELEENLLHAMRACGTIAIFINEAQHLVPISLSKRHEARMAGLGGDWLKGFIDKTSSLLFLLGVTGWDRAFVADLQLGTRVPYRYEFSQFAMDREFVGALTALDEAIPMPERAGLASKTLAPLLFAASQGNWRRLSYLLHDAILHASTRKSPRIELSDLHKAYRVRFGRRDNPFEAVAIT
jgi:hypothetical protein